MGKRRRKPEDEENRENLTEGDSWGRQRDDRDERGEIDEEFLAREYVHAQDEDEAEAKQREKRKPRPEEELDDEVTAEVDDSEDEDENEEGDGFGAGLLTDEDESQEAEEEEAEEEVVEEVPPPPDHPDTIAALRDLGCRLDLNDRGNVWRVFFYEKHGDEAVSHLHGLPSLKELWLVGTKVTRATVERLRVEMPDKKIYYA